VTGRRIRCVSWRLAFKGISRRKSAESGSYVSVVRPCMRYTINCVHCTIRACVILSAVYTLYAHTIRACVILSAVYTVPSVHALYYPLCTAPSVHALYYPLCTLYHPCMRYTTRCVHCTIRACVILPVVYTAPSVHALYYPLCKLYHPCMRYTTRCVHCTIRACVILHINT
jgi:hypothetical protein